MAKKDQTKQDMTLSNQLALYVIGGLALAVVVGYFVVRPLFISAENTKAEVRSVERDITALEQLAEDTEELRRNYEAVRDERDRIIAQLPEENREEDLLALLNQLASRSGVLFTSFRPEGITTTDEANVYETYATKINVNGRHSEVVNFLRAVENSSRFMEFSGVAASGSGNLSVPNPQIGFTLDLKAYYRTAATNQALESQDSAEGEETEDVE